MLKEQIKADTVLAQKSGNELALGTLRMLSAAIFAKEKEKRYKENLSAEPELTDEQVVEVISSEIKKRKDAIALYNQGKRPELAEREQKEMEVLKKYLPAQLPESELRKLISESILKTGAKEIKDMGKVMADINPKIKGKADGAEVSKIVKELLM